MSSLREQASREFAEAWRPKTKGDALEGVVTDRTGNVTQYGSYEILTVVQDDGPELAWHAFHAVGAGELQKKNPVIGDRVCVVYHGKGEAKEGQSAPHLYRVAVESTNGNAEDGMTGAPWLPEDDGPASSQNAVHEGQDIFGGPDD